MSRACGACTACCTIMEIAELEKPAGQPCKHLKADGHGCAIYAERPLPCKGFLCFWLAESKLRQSNKVRLMLRESDRPDQSGVMFHTAPESALAKAGYRILHAREVWPGAFATPAGRHLLDRFALTHVIALGAGDETKPLIGPPDRVQAVMRALEML